MADPPRVTFLIVGVQKGGTTALFDYLGDDADVALSSQKELHFFDDETRDWAAPDYAVYEARFPDPAGRPCGEASPIYSYWPGALARIAAYNPAIKLVLLLRDPVQRAWSHWRMECARGAETQPFSWCIRQGRQRLFDADPWGHHRAFSYVERGFYGEQVARMFELFPREQVLILKSEALRADPGATLGEVRRFLGLGPGPAPVPREVHVSVGGEDLDEVDAGYLRGVYAKDAERLAALTGVRF